MKYILLISLSIITLSSFGQDFGITYKCTISGPSIDSSGTTDCLVRYELVSMGTFKIKWPDNIIGTDYKGIVHVQYEVDKNDSIISTQVVKGLGNGLDGEALRFFQSARSEFQRMFRKGCICRIGSHNDGIKKQVIPMIFRLVQ